MSLLTFSLQDVHESRTVKEINSQSDWDNLTVETSDVININTDVYGGKTIDKSNVRINGNGNKITGYSDYSSGWTDNLDGTFSKTDSEPNWLLYNNAIMKKSETDWIRVLGSPASNQITINHSDVSSYTDIVGSQLTIKIRPWRVSTFVVTAYDGAGTITLSDDLGVTYDSRQMFKLLGKTDYFSGDNEWAYEGGDVVIKSSNTNIQVLDVDNILTIQGSYFNCQDLSFEGFSNYGIIRQLGDNTTINNCTFSKSRGVAINFQSTGVKAIVNNNTITDVGYCGININDNIDITCENNSIDGVGMQPNYAAAPNDEINLSANSGIIINCSNDQTDWYADGSEINNNTIKNVAYCGIKIRGQNNFIRYNIIDGVMLRFSDGGGLYSFGGNINASVVDAENNTYEYNFISNCPANDEGIYNDTAHAYGIYLDDESINANVRHNVIYDCERTFNIKGEGHTIENNTADSSINGLRWVTQPSQDPTRVNDKNNFNNNILVNRVAGYYNIESDIRSSDPDYSPYANGGGADNNYYISPYTSIVGFDTNVNDMTFAQLQSTWGEDANSVEHTNYITAPGDPDNEILLITNPTNAAINGTSPSGNWYDVDGNVVTNYTVNAWSSLLLLKDLSP